jgi:hypothetical protein
MDCFLSGKLSLQSFVTLLFYARQLLLICPNQLIAELGSNAFSSEEKWKNREICWSAKLPKQLAERTTSRYVRGGTDLLTDKSKGARETSFI